MAQESGPAVPVGTISIFAGDVRNSGVYKKLIRAGWLPCDGSMLEVAEYPALFQAIGIAHGGEMSQGHVYRFALPKLPGSYPRGVTGSAIDPVTKRPIDPDVETRTAAAPLGNQKNAVGSSQGGATGAPHNMFVLGEAGEHRHTASHLRNEYHRAYHGTTKDMAEREQASPTVPVAGAHSHKVEAGGDEVTAPLNVGMYYVIRCE